MKLDCQAFRNSTSSQFPILHTHDSFNNSNLITLEIYECPRSLSVITLKPCIPQRSSIHFCNISSSPYHAFRHCLTLGFTVRLLLDMNDLLGGRTDSFALWSMSVVENGVNLPTIVCVCHVITLQMLQRGYS